MMASFYCQELIRNTFYLCHGYITKLQQEKKANANKAKSNSILDPTPQTSAGAPPLKPKSSEDTTANPNAGSGDEGDDPIIIGKQ